ncbi:MAG: heavy-metal-associated domain-containing protein [Chloroflexota bacterium]|nr:heavy-metal-associated domain-containing protein [Chloroflexota bacterium]
MTTTELNVPEITCPHCAQAIEQALAPQPGIAAVQVDVAAQRVTVQYDEGLLALTRIEAILDEEGYPVESTAG